MHHFWQFSCNILLRITHKFKYVIEKGFGVEAENFGGEASPPLDGTLVAEPTTVKVTEPIEA